ncbi:MazG-like family protein [Desmospora activa]|uniref:MazG-like nucleotide pyrophosphohydrolase family protein n=1 Tax=Desmospora activa DSM 45169 TaxID=1121389 RepID=A0A2T4Z4Q5_9BACL|nr:MazG-like family protein [Desmospora activa]PTM56884.1 MazG-like nucleotide pyrophosphohydrolase family protein [Desmospora activa DSM 45169]
MSRPERSVHIAKSMKVIEWLKTEMLDQIANLYKGLHHANRSLIQDSLASLVVATYVLARRVGFSYREVDQAVTRKLREAARERHQLEDWYGDLSQLEEYISKR